MKSKPTHILYEKKIDDVRKKAENKGVLKKKKESLSFHNKFSNEEAFIKLQNLFVILTSSSNSSSLILMVNFKAFLMNVWQSSMIQKKNAEEKNLFVNANKANKKSTQTISKTFPKNKTNLHDRNRKTLNISKCDWTQMIIV